MDHISDKILIDKFLSKTLLEEEKVLFEQRKNDEAFLALLEEAVIAYKGRLALKTQLQQIGNDLKTEHTTTSKKPIFWISGIAASILLFFAIQFFLTRDTASTTLFDTYFEVYPNIYTTKGTSSSDTETKKAFVLYDNEKYTEAVTAFKNIASNKKLSSSECFYYGISALTIGETENAKMQFKNVSKAHPLYNEALWYTGLALIKQDSLVKAKTLLSSKELNSSTYRNNKLKKLLNELK